jgi:hypothetical protein
VGTPQPDPLSGRVIHLPFFSSVTKTLYSQPFRIVYNVCQDIVQKPHFHHRINLNQSPCARALMRLSFCQTLNAESALVPRRAEENQPWTYRGDCCSAGY